MSDADYDALARRILDLEAENALLKERHVWADARRLRAEKRAASATREMHRLRYCEDTANDVCRALGLDPDETSRGAVLTAIENLRSYERMWSGELERFGVRFVDDDEVIGVYWLPAPKGQPVAGSLREALEARAAELRAEAYGQAIDACRRVRTKRYDDEESIEAAIEAIGALREAP